MVAVTARASLTRSIGCDLSRDTFTGRRIRYSQPHEAPYQFIFKLPDVAHDPGVEAWQLADAQDDEREKKGGKLKKVKKDMLATAEKERFSETQVRSKQMLHA
eukprot:324839-Pleurochrysis_carterae.AAC.1